MDEEQDLTDKMIIVPSEQTADLGFSGLVSQDAVYALQTATPWVNYADPGQVPIFQDGWTREQIQTETLRHAAHKGCFTSEGNIRRAVNAGLNKATPRMFRRVPGGTVGVRTFRPTDDPKEILRNLRSNYGRMTPQEKTAMETRWSAGWNPSEPVENFFDRLEDCFVMATAQPPSGIIQSSGFLFSLYRSFVRWCPSAQ